jgi:CBS domain-containing protein
MEAWGFMTETDLIEKVVTGGVDLESITVSPKSSLQECDALLTKADIRRVLVFDGQEIVGFVSISDTFSAV